VCVYDRAIYGLTDSLDRSCVVLVVCWGTYECVWEDSIYVNVWARKLVILIFTQNMGKTERERERRREIEGERERGKKNGKWILLANKWMNTARYVHTPIVLRAFCSKNRFSLSLVARLFHFCSFSLSLSPSKYLEKAIKRLLIEMKYNQLCVCVACGIGVFS